ncbi:Uncharacterised protein [Mycobacterium tuberculosis]|nr:Uncharacterised protein [Mycobacterium tuberculosis]
MSDSGEFTYLGTFLSVFRVLAPNPITLPVKLWMGKITRPLNLSYSEPSSRSIASPVSRRKSVEWPSFLAESTRAVQFSGEYPSSNFLMVSSR